MSQSTAQQPVTIDEVLKELALIGDAINHYSGNDLTGYKPFSSLVLEERISILGDAITGLIALEIVRSKNLKETQ